jgi:uncharacterized membrane protein
MKSIARSTVVPAVWAGLPLLCVAALLRSIGVTSRWLWLDELMTANWSVHGVWSALVNVVRFDVHPPLYYLQLSLWALLGHSDLWLMANAILWSSAAVLFLTYTAAQIYDLRTGLYSGILLAVSPAALAYADQVRMYNFVMFLLIGVWYAQERWLRGNGGRWRSMWLAVSQLAVIYSHGAGVVMISGCVLYGAARVFVSRQRSLIVRWLVIECVVGFLAIPAAAIAILRGVSHPSVPRLADFAATWEFLTAGTSGANGGPWAAALAAALFAGIGVLAIFDRKTRLPFATLVFGPMVVAATLSYIYKPIWLPRLFVPTVPLICLTVAVSIISAVGDRGKRGVGTAAFAILVVAWASTGVFEQFTRAKGDGYKLAAELVQRLARPGDVILVDGHVNYWCFLWYYVGPDWGDPRHAFILNNDWARMMKRLPAATSAWLGLNETATIVHNGPVTVRLWDGKTPPPAGQGDVIVIGSGPPDEVRFAGGRLVSTNKEMHIYVERWQL